MALWRGHGNFPSINLRECSLAAEPTFALCAILKDEADYIEEWLAFHILQGVSRVILYDNNSSDDTCERAWSLAKSIDIQVISWPDSARGFDRTQRRAYVDGARRRSGAADYVAFIGHPGFSSLITEGALRLHHYMLKSRQEFERKRQRWAGQDLSNRLTEEYFSDRDRSVNTVRDERLTVFAERIRELIGRARGGAR